MFKPGDKVLWTDPNNDIECDCSKEFTITKLFDKGEFLHVLGTGTYGDQTEYDVDLECFEHELSLLDD